MTELVKWERAKVAIKEARTVDEVKGIRDKAEALRQYAKQAGECLEVQNNVCEIKLRAERRMGEMIPGEIDKGGDKRWHPKSPDVTLDDLGISRQQSSRYQAMARLPEDIFESHIEETKEANQELTTAGILRLAGRLASNLHTSDDTYEWFTPPEYIEAAKRVMGGIDLDPASCEEAQTIVRARRFYGKEDDGLSKNWKGSVWMNPPYSMPEIEAFVEKCVGSFKSGEVNQAIVLTNNSTDTGWFHLLAEYPFCLTRGRIQFQAANGEKLATRQGQAIFYLGKSVKSFIREFSTFGIVVGKL